MFKLECQVIDRNPDFQMQGRDFLRRIDWATNGSYWEQDCPLRDTAFPTVDPADPAALNDDEKLVLRKLVQSFRQSEKLQQHVEFLYAKGSVYHIENGNLLYHGVVPMTAKGSFAVERFEGRRYSGRALMDYCDARARRGLLRTGGQRRTPERTGFFVVSVVRAVVTAVRPQRYDHLRAAVCGRPRHP